MLKKLMPKNKKILTVLAVFVFALPVFAISPVRSWMTDMWNQVSVKPQEGGSIMEFPFDSVTTDGIVVTSDGFQNYYASQGLWMIYRNDAAIAPVNPIPKTAQSIQDGEYLYNVYCTTCHGDDGMAQTPVGLLRGAVPISLIIQSDPTLTEGYLYSKIQYGGVIVEGMPAFGYQTTAKDRWNIVNYIEDKWAPKTSNN